MFGLIAQQIYQSQRVNRALLVTGGILALLLAMTLLAVGIGAVFIGPGRVLAILFDQIHISLPWAYEAREQMILLNIRLPRVLLTILVGAALSISGAALQGLFRNPLADPGLIGISSGAALFASVAILASGAIAAQFGPLVGEMLLPVAAFLGGIAVTMVVYHVSTQRGQTNVAVMLLAGVAINALANAGIGYVIFMANDEELRDITFWMLGSMNGAMWQTVLTAAPFMLIAILMLPALSRGLNALLMGEAEACHLGINVEGLKKRIILFTAAAVGAAVSISGVIGFVGLVVPHLLRLMIGPDNRFLLPGSALLGAALLLGADLVSRNIVAPAELPIGIVTATLGAPFFLWLLLRNKTLSNYL